MVALTSADFSQIPMSASLAATLARASESASVAGSGEVTLEHVLSALCDDPEAGAVLDASQVNVERLKAEAAEYLSRTMQRAEPGQLELAIAPAVKRILEAAAAAARGGRRRDINGAIVLAAIIGDGKSAASQMLQAQGLTFDEAIRALQAALSQPQRDAVAAANPAAAEVVLARARERVSSRTAPSLREIMQDLPRQPAPLPPFQPLPPNHEWPPQTNLVPEPVSQPDWPALQMPSMPSAPSPGPSHNGIWQKAEVTVEIERDAETSTGGSVLTEQPTSPAPFPIAPAPSFPASGPEPSPAQRGGGVAAPSFDMSQMGSSAAAPRTAEPQIMQPVPQPAQPVALPAASSPAPSAAPASVNSAAPAPLPSAAPASEHSAAPPPVVPQPYAIPQSANQSQQTAPPAQAFNHGQPPPSGPYAYPSGQPMGRPAAAPPASPFERPHAFDLGRVAPGAPPPPMPPPIPRPAGPAAGGGGPPSNAKFSARSQPAPGGMRPGPPVADAMPSLQSREPAASAKRERQQHSETGQLAENIPRSMRVGASERVEVRIAKAHVKAIAQGLEGGGAAWHHDVTVTQAMSVRLRAPDGGFFIETASPETQWVENQLGLMSGDDVASWRFLVTPQKRGKARLQIIVSARTVGGDGLAAETALPDQVIEVKVRTNYKRVLLRWTGWLLAAIAGGAFAKFGEGAFEMARALVMQFLH